MLFQQCNGQDKKNLMNNAKTSANLLDTVNLTPFEPAVSKVLNMDYVEDERH